MLLVSKESTGKPENRKTVIGSGDTQGDIHSFGDLKVGRSETTTKHFYTTKTQLENGMLPHH
jgi:hypothetical protein